MHKSVENLCKSLDGFGTRVLNGWTGNQAFVEAWGWNCLPFTRQDLASLPINLSKRLKDTNPEELESAHVKLIDGIPPKIDLIINNTLPQLYNGNNAFAGLVIVTFMNWVESTLQPNIGLDNYSGLESHARPTRPET